MAEERTLIIKILSVRNADVCICRKNNSECVFIKAPLPPSAAMPVIHRRKISARDFIEFEATAVSK